MNKALPKNPEHMQQVANPSHKILPLLGYKAPSLDFFRVLMTEGTKIGGLLKQSHHVVSYSWLSEVHHSKIP